MVILKIDLMLIPQTCLPLDQNRNPPTNVYQLINVMNPGTSKCWCGWQNLVTARLLCPADHLAEFDVNPEM